MRLGEDVFKDAAVRVEGRETNSLEGHAILDVQTVSFSLSVDEDKCVLVPQKVFARARDEGEVGCMGRSILRRECLYLEVVHAGVYAIEDLGKHATLRKRSCADLLCAVVVGHPLEEPRIGVVMACYLQIDEHAPTYECGAMLESLLASTRCDSKRCETEALRHVSTRPTLFNATEFHTAVKKGFSLIWAKREPLFALLLAVMCFASSCCGALGSMSCV